MSVDDLPTRIASKISVADTGCWEWRGSLWRGYGRASVGGAGVQAHRLTYHLLRDSAFPIRPGGPHVGLQLDHLCRNSRCVNPDHLEPVTHAENMLRARLDRPHGHPTVYARGCRCDECRNGERDRIREWRSTRQWKLADADPRHGTTNGYFNLRCRCADCKAAGAEANRRQHARRNAAA